MEARHRDPAVGAGARALKSVKSEPASQPRARCYARLGTNAKVTFHSGNPKTKPTTHVANGEGVVLITDKLSLDDLAPTIDWNVESALPEQATPASLFGGLAVLEYLRDGLLRDFAAQLAAAGKDGAKVADAWDQVLDVAYGAARRTIRSSPRSASARSRTLRPASLPPRPRSRQRGSRATESRSPRTSRTR